MSSNRKFYQIVEGGFTDQAVKEFKLSYKAVVDSWAAFSEKYAGQDIWAGSSIEGLIFSEGQEPEGWETIQKLPKNCFKPLRRKVCMDAYKEFKSLERIPGVFELRNKLGCGDVHVGGVLSHDSERAVAVGAI